MHMKHLYCPSQVAKNQAAKRIQPINHKNHTLKAVQVHHLNVLGMMKNMDNSQENILRAPFPL